MVAKGHPDETRAIGPTEALARALAAATARRGRHTGKGIGRLVELRRRFQDILDRPTAGSDFVDLSNAAFTHLAMKGPEAVTVDLGLIGKYSKYPHRKYDGLRYTQTFEKRFRFAIRPHRCVLNPAVSHADWHAKHTVDRFFPGAGRAGNEVSYATHQSRDPQGRLDDI